MKFLVAALLTYAVFALVFLSQPTPPHRLKTTDKYRLAAVDSSRNVVIETPRYTGVIFAREETRRP